MSRTPRVTGRELLAALAKAGFSVLRIRGSHHFLRHQDGRSTVVPAHSGETIGPGLLQKILRDCEMNPSACRISSESGYSPSMPQPS
jgi:predicted RNA binding protein YcfA (HicA-like mRNA interferase family)